MAIYMHSNDWHPSERTIAYFPFKDDKVDHSWNDMFLTNTSLLSKWNIWYVCTFSQWSSSVTYKVQLAWWWNAKYISIRYKINSSSWNTGLLSLEKYWNVWYAPSHWNTSLSNKISVFTSSSFTVWAQSAWLSFNAWHHISVWYDWSKILISKDWVQSTLYNWSWYQFSEIVSLVNMWSEANINYEISDAIIEDTCRTQSEITSYYNSTKSKYWIS